MEVQPGSRSRGWVYAAVLVGAVVATAAATGLLVNIFERKQETKAPYLRVVEVTEQDVDPAKWGRNWPRQYDGYRMTGQPSATKYGGGTVGPEGGLPPQKSERDPWLKRIFAGYLFAVDYRDRRGHAHMLEDQEITKRNIPDQGKQSGNCLHCHASIVPLYRKLGAQALPGGSAYDQLLKGLEEVGKLGYWDAHKLLAETTGGKAHPVACLDCHDPQSMELRVTRPGFLAGIARLAASTAEVPHLPSVDRWRAGGRNRPFDPNQDATRQEMRSFVCGQCHVEYYCGKGATLFFPWDQGLKVEQIEAHYNGLQVKGERFKDWVHADTGMPMLKAQHPEFEVWSQGVHARSGVACADCHMPYKREGAMKVSEHWVRSPLLMANRSCAPCHPSGDAELQARVTTIQDRHFALMSRAGQAVVDLLDAIAVLRKQVETAPSAAADAWKLAVANDPQLKQIAELQRAAQWRLDFVAAENSMGFHAPQELARILGEAIDLARQGQVLAAVLATSRGAPLAPPPGPAGAAPAMPAPPTPAAL
jgi:nitrite reductase (cytochrome c-552)